MIKCALRVHLASIVPSPASVFTERVVPLTVRAHVVLATMATSVTGLVPEGSMDLDVV